LPRYADRRGEPDLTTPAEVRRILKLTKANSSDVFYDLGCGYGKVCINAAKVVRFAVGIEDHIDIYREAKELVAKSDVAGKVRIKHADFYSSRPSDATIIFTILDEDDGDLDFYEKHLKKGCRVVTEYVPFIGIKPDRKDGKFYMMQVPFKRAKDDEDWAKSVLHTKNASASRLYKKLRHEYGLKYVRDLRKTLSKRLTEWDDNRF
jgi:SAM-dependent methyltransferase